MRQMFIRQILADAIPKFQKITRQMLCDKCSKNDVTLTLKLQTSYGGKNTDPQNADVIWREIYHRWGVLNYSGLVSTGLRSKRDCMYSTISCSGFCLVKFYFSYFNYYIYYIVT
jgi:hypothetical protein